MHYCSVQQCLNSDLLCYENYWWLTSLWWYWSHEPVSYGYLLVWSCSANWGSECRRTCVSVCSVFSRDEKQSYLQFADVSEWGPGYSYCGVWLSGWQGSNRFLQTYWSIVCFHKLLYKGSFPEFLTCTQILQEWNRPCTRKVTPIPFLNIGTMSKPFNRQIHHKETL